MQRSWLTSLGLDGGRKGETWSCHVRGIGNVTVTGTAAPKQAGDVKINDSSLRTPNNEPRNCIYIESNFGLESEPKVFSLSRPVSYQKEYFAS